MSIRRLVEAAAAMAAVAVVLRLLTPSFAEMTATALDARRMTGSAGAEAVVLAATGLLAWGVWVWGALGLLLTAASALPGGLGAAADVLTGVVLPGGARRGAALALGLGLGVAAPMAGTAVLVATAPAAAADAAPTTVPDWPSTGSTALPDRPGITPADVASGPTPAVPSTATALPDWPVAPWAGDHVVVRGDCLWDIAAARLSDRLGRAPTDAEVARDTRAWWRANAEVIGPDPDVLLTGQVLRPPAA